MASRRPFRGGVFLPETRSLGHQAEPSEFCLRLLSGNQLLDKPVGHLEIFEDVRILHKHLSSGVYKLRLEVKTCSGSLNGFLLNVFGSITDWHIGQTLRAAPVQSAIGARSPFTLGQVGRGTHPRRIRPSSPTKERKCDLPSSPSLT